MVKYHHVGKISQSFNRSSFLLFSTFTNRLDPHFTHFVCNFEYIDIATTKNDTNVIDTIAAFVLVVEFWTLRHSNSDSGTGFDNNFQSFPNPLCGE
mmetsp:Transcript_23685/g.52704  ORF Transcript_23685/g.52704 Transcript_23685/m.52704 type:complete len:96 (-) Transcript_23685:803-1090(-)